MNIAACSASSVWGTAELSVQNSSHANAMQLLLQADEIGQKILQSTDLK